MTVNKIICSALRLVGRDDVADAIEGESQLSAEFNRIKNAFLTYFNSVLDELARAYFPLSEREAISCTGGKITLSSLRRRAVKIKKILSGKKSVEWQVYGSELLVDCDEEAIIFYEYSPAPLREEDEFFYPEYAVSERLVQYGMVAEYYLVCGCAEEMHAWEEKYRDEIESIVARCIVKPKVPPRRWI